MPTVKHGKGTSQFGPGVQINLTGDEVAHAIDIYLLSQDIIVRGPRTIRYDGELLEDNCCEVYVDPSGSAMQNGVRFTGRGGTE